MINLFIVLAVATAIAGAAAPVATLVIREYKTERRRIESGVEPEMLPESRPVDTYRSTNQRFQEVEEVRVEPKK